MNSPDVKVFSWSMIKFVHGGPPASSTLYLQRENVIETDHVVTFLFCWGITMSANLRFFTYKYTEINLWAQAFKKKNPDKRILTPTS